MKLKKKYLGIILSICLMVAFVFTGCNETPIVYAWDKTFNYAGNFYDNYGSYSAKTDQNGNVLENGTATKALLEKQYNENNLLLSSATIDDEPIDLSNANSFSNLIQIMEQKASDRLAKYNGYTVSISSKDDLKITINGTDYSLQDNSGNNYGIMDNEERVGYCTTAITDNVNNKSLKNSLMINVYKTKNNFESVKIRIKTRTTITDPTAEKETNENNEVIETSIYITYTPVLTMVTE